MDSQAGVVGLPCASTTFGCSVQALTLFFFPDVISKQVYSSHPFLLLSLECAGCLVYLSRLSTVGLL